MELRRSIKGYAGMTYCHECNRGGNGNDKDKCACGWKQYKKSSKGCFLGSPIIGEKKYNEKKAKLINEILQYCKASNVPTTGDLFFSLAFRTESELINIAKELHIK